MSMPTEFSNNRPVDPKTLSISPSKSYYRAMARLGTNFFKNSTADKPCLLSELERKKSNDSNISPLPQSDENLESHFNNLSINDSPVDMNNDPGLSFSPTESIVSVGDIPNQTSFDSFEQSNNLPPPLTRVRRAKTAYSSIPRNNEFKRHNPHKPITSASYHSLPASAAVSFLSSFADSTAAELNSVLPDEEGEEVGNYIMGKIIAKGATSVVREAYTITEGAEQFHMLACKVIKKCPTSKCEEKVLETENEVMLWKQLDHPNVLKFVDMIDTSYALFIFMELCPNGTLLDYVTSKGKLEESEAKRFFLELAEAIRYLHQDVHIIHRDLKLENIVLTSSNHLKLTDFGLSLFHKLDHGRASFDPKKSSACAGSLNYCPPEFLNNVGTNEYSSDIWSLGIILYTLVVGRFPFSDGFEPRLKLKICSGKFEIPDNLSPSLKKLLSSMLNTNFVERPSIHQILNDEWCKN